MKHIFVAALFAVALAAHPLPAYAQLGGGHGGAGGHAMSAGGFHAARGGGATLRAPRAGPAVGHPVPRGAPAYRPYRGYGYGAYGLYGGAFGLGYYDPYWDWTYGYPPDGYAPPYVVPPDAVTGGLRIEVKPDTAAVYVDGYYAGIVDDFDGHFQHLDLTPGGHHIEVRAPGYAPLTFDPLIQADHTTDFKGRLVPSNAATP